MPTSVSSVLAVCAFGKDWGPLKRELLIKEEDTIEIDGQKYWRIAPHSSGIVSFVAKGAPGAPQPMPKNMSLTRSKGWQHLAMLRNETAWPSPRQVACALFDDSEQSPLMQKPRRKLVGPGLPPTVSITIPAVCDRGEFQLWVQRPTHPSDRLAIPIAPESIDHVLFYMHASGFEDAKPRARPDDAPKGVWWNKQRKRYLMKVNNGERSFKSARTVGELEA